MRRTRRRRQAESGMCPWLVLCFHVPPFLTHVHRQVVHQPKSPRYTSTLGGAEPPPGGDAHTILLSDVILPNLKNAPTKDGGGDEIIFYSHFFYSLKIYFPSVFNEIFFLPKMHKIQFILAFFFASGFLKNVGSYSKKYILNILLPNFSTGIFFINAFWKPNTDINCY